MLDQQNNAGSVSALSGFETGTATRRYDLDWLRVIAFGLLIFYHVGMFYVSWGWHVKSIHAGSAAEPLMMIINPWRLALLFFISGVAIRFATDKVRSSWSFARSRLHRLGLPILFGIVVIVAPQSYFELRQAGEIDPGYLAFWGNYLKLEQLYPMITPTWNHLWYVVYLLVYILLLTPVLPMLRHFAEGRGGGWFGVITGTPLRLLGLVIIPFVLIEMYLSPHFPETHDLFNDWANHANRFIIFMVGYFAAKNAKFWRSVDKALPLAVLLVVGLGLLRFAVREFSELFSGPLWHGSHMTIVATLYAWSFIVMLLGLAMRYLNRPSKLLTYFTGAVFCYYILHQTIIVIFGYYLTQLNLSVSLEFLLVMIATILGCAAGFEVAKRIPIFRVLLGIKRVRQINKARL